MSGLDRLQDSVRSGAVPSLGADGKAQVTSKDGRRYSLSTGSPTAGKGDGVAREVMHGRSEKRGAVLEIREGKEAEVCMRMESDLHAQLQELEGRVAALTDGKIEDVEKLFDDVHLLKDSLLLPLQALGRSSEAMNRRLEEVERKAVVSGVRAATKAAHEAPPAEFLNTLKMKLGGLREIFQAHADPAQLEAFMLENILQEDIYKLYIDALSLLNTEGCTENTLSHIEQLLGYQEVVELFCAAQPEGSKVGQKVLGDMERCLASVAAKTKGLLFDSLKSDRDLLVKGPLHEKLADIFSKSPHFFFRDSFIRLEGALEKRSPEEFFSAVRQLSDVVDFFTTISLSIPDDERERIEKLVKQGMPYIQALYEKSTRELSQGKWADAIKTWVQAHEISESMSRLCHGTEIFFIQQDYKSKNESSFETLLKKTRDVSIPMELSEAVQPSSDLSSYSGKDAEEIKRYEALAPDMKSLVTTYPRGITNVRIGGAPVTLRPGAGGTDISLVYQLGKTLEQEYLKKNPKASPADVEAMVLDLLTYVTIDHSSTGFLQSVGETDTRKWKQDATTYSASFSVEKGKLVGKGTIVLKEAEPDYEGAPVPTGRAVRYTWEVALVPGQERGKWVEKVKIETTRA